VSTWIRRNEKNNPGLIPGTLLQPFWITFFHQISEKMFFLKTSNELLFFSLDIGEDIENEQKHQ
jgi:hypothetical protein